MSLGVNFAKVFGELLSFGLDVSHVNLSRNRLKDEGIKLLAKNLMVNKTIIHLDISQNEISHRGAEELFERLSSNESIISIDVGCYDGSSRNRIGLKGLNKLQEIL
jgi:hypothetical protein